MWLIHFWVRMEGQYQDKIDTCSTYARFLFDLSCADYKYYEHRVQEEEKLLAHQKEAQLSHPGLHSPIIKSLLMFYWSVSKIN